MSDTAQLPSWLKPLNRVIIALQRLNLPIGTMRILSVPGRSSGKLRSTPVSPLVVDGQRYIIGGAAESDWVKNAQAAGWGFLAHGRKGEKVALVEPPIEERVPVLRAFPREVPHGVQFFQQMYGLSKDTAALPDAFAALAPQCPVFRIEPAPADATTARTGSPPVSRA